MLHAYRKGHKIDTQLNGLSESKHSPPGTGNGALKVSQNHSRPWILSQCPSFPARVNRYPDARDNRFLAFLRNFTTKCPWTLLWCAYLIELWNLAACLPSGFFHSLPHRRHIHWCSHILVIERFLPTFTSRALPKPCLWGPLTGFWSQPHHVLIAGPYVGSYFPQACLWILWIHSRSLRSWPGTGACHPTWDFQNWVWIWLYHFLTVVVLNEILLLSETLFSLCKMVIIFTLWDGLKTFKCRHMADIIYYKLFTSSTCRYIEHTIDKATTRKRGTFSPLSLKACQ